MEYVDSLRNAVAAAVIADIGSAAQFVLAKNHAGRTKTDAIPSGDQLAVVTLGSPFGSASAGVITINTGSPVTTANDGTADGFSILTSGGTPKIKGSVTTTGGGGDLEMDNTSVLAGGTFTLTTARITVGNP